MAKFTGFWEVSGPGVEPEVATTISYVPVDELLERLRARREQLKPGTHIRIDLISWDEQTLERGDDDPVQ
jgi:hypothetical protein